MAMKTKTMIIIALIALAAGLWMTTRGSSEDARLVPAWQLTVDQAYDGEPSQDPVMSWSPDSKSLLFAVVGLQSHKFSILKWNVGDQRAERATYGVCPNYVDNDSFMLFRSSPLGIYERNLVTGKESPIAPNLRKLDLWKEISAFSYDPVRKTIALRFSGFTRYYEPGCQEVDLTGKFLGNVCRTTGDGVLDRSLDPKGGQSAVILGDLAGKTRELRISPQGGDAKGRVAASGNLGAVAWSPNGRVVAYAEDNTVKALDPSTMKIATVARFGKLPESGDKPYVCRLLWSPDGDYLAAMELVPGDYVTFEMIYALDMSKLKW